MRIFSLTHRRVGSAAVAVRLPTRCLVVLVGPSSAGKSTWAAANFRPNQIVNSDHLRAVAGLDEHDQRASADAFAVLDLVVERRLKRGLLTVVDTLALDDKLRLGYIEVARRHGAAVHAIAFDTPAAECRARNKAKDRPIPARVLSGHLKTWERVREQLGNESFDAVHAPDAVRIAAAEVLTAPDAHDRQKEDPMTLQFGLQIPSFTWDGGSDEIGPRLGAIAAAAEEAGFASLWVMDHMVQIPFAGREWDEMLESYTTLSFLAGRTERIRLGAMVTGITYRNVAHLAKIVATLDVLSGGRANCGIGAAWFESEHKYYGWDFPPTPERLALLEDALELLPLMWGKGTPSYEGRLLKIPKAICYPRPLQEHVPILVGGSGEHKTLRLVARHADACNLFGDAQRVRHLVGVLHGHCEAEGRDPAEVEVTALAQALIGRDNEHLAELIAARAPANEGPEAYAERVNAGTIEDHIGRYRELAEAGVQTAVVSFPDLGDTQPVERFAPIVDAFRN